MTTFEIEQIHGPLDHKTFMPMVALVKRLPNNDIHELSHTDLKEHLQNRADNDNSALFVAQTMGRHTVGLAGVEIHDETAVLTELSVDRRAQGHRLGWNLVHRLVEWSDTQGARIVEVSPPPEPGSAGEALLQEMGFSDQNGNFRLKLADSPLIQD